MNKVQSFVASQLAALLLLCGVWAYKHQSVAARPVSPQPILVQPLPLPPLPPIQPVNPELVGVQVGIPQDQRIFNKSGSQCVWCTIQMLGRWNHVAKLEGLTDKYKHATGPGEVKRVLDGLGVKFKQTINRDENMLEEYVTKKKYGCGIGVNGNHVILVCHFDKPNNQVKVIDNSDRKLRIQTWTLEQLRSKWSDWTFVIFPEGAKETAAQNEPLQDGQYVQWWNSRR